MSDLKRYRFDYRGDPFADKSGDWYKAADADAEILRLRAERDRSVADKSELLRVLDRLTSSIAEQQHTLGSKGWHVDNFGRWSAAGARWEQYREVDAALTDATDALASANPSTLERRGPYADMEREVRRLRALLAERERRKEAGR